MTDLNQFSPGKGGTRQKHRDAVASRRLNGCPSRRNVETCCVVEDLHQLGDEGATHVPQRAGRSTRGQRNAASWKTSQARLGMTSGREVIDLCILKSNHARTTRSRA